MADAPEKIEATVILLANAPTVTSAMVSNAMQQPRNYSTLDAVTAIVSRNQFPVE